MQNLLYKFQLVTQNLLRKFRPVMQDLPSVCIPEYISPCKICCIGETVDSTSNVVSLQDLVGSTKSGCSICHLRYLAICIYIPGLLHRKSGVELSFQFSGPVINIKMTWGTGNRESQVDANDNILLYTTKLSKPNPFAPFIGIGQDVGHRVSSHVPVIIGWLRECHQNHPDCPSSTDVDLPTRVLDVGDNCSDLVRLIEVTSGQQGHYTALSHCWGGGIDIRTTKGNYVAQKKGLRYSDLPLSFQHAATVTRGLGLKYLWIDALCIVQDSQDDWEIESGNMAAIYRNAHLVIGADMSPNSAGGFLDVQSGGYNGDGQPIATVNDDIIYARSEHNGNNDYRGAHPFDSEPLSTRAWTLQEQLLSSRMVHFASKEMIWECKSALSCECKQIERGNFAMITPISPRNLVNLSFPAMFRTWYKLVNEVNTRSLTKSEDLLPCLSGMAQHFQDSGAGSYLAGLWYRDLPLGLLWMPWSPSQYPRAIPYRGPSWSWTSIDGIIYPYDTNNGFTDHDNTLKKAYANIIEAKCIPAGKDPLGAVSGAWLRVAAPLLKLEENLGITPHYDSDKFQKENLFCLFIGEVTCWAFGRPVLGLILQQQCMSTLTFERVGYFSLESGDEIKFIKDVEDSIVTIV